MSRRSDGETMSPRRLHKGDIAGGQRLSAQAGWNQTEHDWKLMIEAGQGIGFVDPQEELIATAILVPYRSNVDWVSMILVDAAWRKRGLGRRLTRLIVELSPRPILGLDATDMGYPIYRDLGFKKSEGIIRFRRAPRPAPVAAETSQISAVSRQEFAHCLNLFIRDSEPVRTDLLCALDSDRQGRVRMVREDRTAAVGLVREGRATTHIGPLLATDAGSATTLLRWIASTTDKPLSIDVYERHRALVGQMPNLGFEPSRSFTRMFRGGLPPVNPAEYAVTGPEFG